MALRQTYTKTLVPTFLWNCTICRNNNVRSKRSHLRGMVYPCTGTCTGRGQWGGSQSMQVDFHLHGKGGGGSSSMQINLQKRGKGLIPWAQAFWARAQSENRSMWAQALFGPGSWYGVPRALGPRDLYMCVSSVLLSPLWRWRYHPYGGFIIPAFTALKRAGTDASMFEDVHWHIAERCTSEYW